MPLVVIVPDRSHFDDEFRDQLLAGADQQAVVHLNEMFGRKFSSLSDADDFLEKLDTPEAITKEMADPKRLLFDVDDRGTPAENLAAFMKGPYRHALSVETVADAVRIVAISRMRQATDLQHRSHRLGGVPLIDAPTSWRYFNWSLAYGAQAEVEARKAMHITKALQSAAEGEIQWLGAVPIDALIEMQKLGALPELREILGNGICELIELRPDNFYRTSDQVIDNLQRAFDDHRQRLSTLTGKAWRFAGVELGSCIVKGATQIASACGVPWVSLLGAALDEVMDVPKLKELPSRGRQIWAEKQVAKRSAVGRLFQIADKGR